MAVEFDEDKPRANGTLLLDQVKVLRELIQLSGWDDPSELELVGIGTAVEVVLRLAGRRHPRVTWKRCPGGASFTATWKV